MDTAEQLEVDGREEDSSCKYAHKCVSPDTSPLTFPETADPCGIAPEDAIFPGHCAPRHLARLPECEHPIDCTAMLK